MSFWKKLFSSDHRAALSAEASGDFELAAERYALAGQHSDAVRMHLARAERAPTRAAEIDALRDALHWAREDDSLRLARSSLGEALLAQAQAETVQTERDRERVLEAAELLVLAGAYERAGDAYANIDETTRAADAYRSGGLVAKLEHLLTVDQDRGSRKRTVENAFADYMLNMQGGDRDAALGMLRTCLEHAEQKADYQTLLDELEGRIITGGRVRLQRRNHPPLTLCASPEVLMGRDALCDLILRTGGVSRQHASILVRGDDGHIEFELSDAGSRNGTRVGGMELSGPLVLRGRGEFALGDTARIAYERNGDAPVLTLEISAGLDRGTKLLTTVDGHPLSLEPLGVPAEVVFRSGRPVLLQPRGSLRLGGQPIQHGDVQLINGDEFTIDGVSIEVC